MINIKFNAANTINYLAGMDDNLRKAQISATNKMAQQGRSEASRRIRRRYSVSVEGLTSENAYGHNVLGYTKATVSNGMKSAVVARGKGLSLKYFSSFQEVTGVSVEVRKGKRHIIKGSFGRNIPRLGGNVFVRALKEGSTEKRVNRTPIKKLLGPGVATMLNRDVIKGVIALIDRKFKSIMDHEIKYYLKIK